MQSDTKKVAILTTFSSADTAYSLNRVVQDQIKMLLAFDYKPIVIVQKGFTPKEAYSLPGVELSYMPTVTASNEGILPEAWEKEVSDLNDALYEALKEVSVCIGHDIISQPASLIYNLAARKVADSLPQLRWLHWIHSVFSSNLPSNIWQASKTGREKFPNSVIVFPNSYDIPRLARNFHFEETDIKWCPHPTDIEEFFSMQEVSRRFIRAKDLLAADIMIVYPCRLDRGKQPHFIVEFAGACKRIGLTVRAIILDFHSTGGDKVTYREEMKVRGKELGLTDQELSFFSEFDPQFKYEAPHAVVKDLMSISNIFIMPSVSETYSLVTQEAILTGNFIFLNQDFAPFRSIFGDLPKYYQFSSAIGMDGYDGAITTTYSSLENYFNDMAQYAKYMLTYDKALALRTETRRDRNLYSVFQNYLEPLLHEN